MVNQLYPLEKYFDHPLGGLGGSRACLIGTAWYPKQNNNKNMPKGYLMLNADPMDLGHGKKYVSTKKIWFQMSGIACQDIATLRLKQQPGRFSEKCVLENHCRLDINSLNDVQVAQAISSVEVRLHCKRCSPNLSCIFLGGSSLSPSRSVLMFLIPTKPCLVRYLSCIQKNIVHMLKTLQICAIKKLS